MRQLDPQVAANRDLDIFCWAIYRGREIDSQEKMLQEMMALGFKVNNAFEKVKILKKQ